MARIRFTDLAVQKLNPPAEGRVELQDEIIRGLWLRITDKGHKSWAVAYRYYGKQKRYTIGSYPGVLTVDARKAAQETLRLVANGEDPNYLKKEKITSAKVDECTRLAIERHNDPEAYKIELMERQTRALEAQQNGSTVCLPMAGGRVCQPLR